MQISAQTMGSLVEVVRSDKLAYTDLGNDGGVMLDIDGHQVFNLNEVGMYLINLIREQGMDSLDNITQQLVTDFEVEEAVAQADIHEFFEKLVRFLKLY